MAKAVRPNDRNRSRSREDVSTRSARRRPRTRIALREAVEAQIDDFLRSAGAEDPAALTDEDGRRLLQLGSVEGCVAAVEADGEVYLRVETRVLQLPSDADLILLLMRDALALNHSMPGASRLTLDKEALWLVGMLHVSELQEGDVAHCIRSVMTHGDNLDDILREQYGGTSKQRTPLSALERVTPTAQ